MRNWKHIARPLAVMPLALLFLLAGAPGYGAPVEGRVGIMQLLDRALAADSMNPATISVDSAAGVAGGLRFKIAPGSIAPVLVPVRANVPEAGPEDHLVFVANTAADKSPFAEGEVWRGQAFSAPVVDRYEAFVDVAELLEGLQAGQTVDVAFSALVNAVTTPQAGELLYETASLPGAAHHVSVHTLDNAYDADLNGLPDDLASMLPGEVWVAFVRIPGLARDGTEDAWRLVLVMNLAGTLADGPGTVRVSPVPGLTVEAPDFEALLDAGIFPDRFIWEAFGLLVVQVATALPAMVDEPEGEPAIERRERWADSAREAMPGPPLTFFGGWDQWVSVNLLYSLDGGGSFASVSDLGLRADGLPAEELLDISLAFEQPPASTLDASAYHYPLTLSLDANPTFARRVGRWSPLPGTVSMGGQETQVRFQRTGAVAFFGGDGAARVGFEGEFAAEEVAEPDAKPRGDGALAVHAISPDSAWLFGGVVATVRGEGFTEDTAFLFGGRPAAQAAVLDERTAKVIVPPFRGNGQRARVAVELAARQDGQVAAAPKKFTYRRHDDWSGESITAFVVSRPEAGRAGIELAVDKATLDLPPIPVSEGTEAVYGLLRMAPGSGEEAPSEEGGHAIPGAYQFSLHLYVETQLPPDVLCQLAYGYDTLDEIDFGTAWRTRRGEPAHISLPMNGAELSYDDIVRGRLSLWGQRSRFDYVNCAPKQITSAPPRYQSSVLAYEVKPGLGKAMARQGEDFAEKAAGLRPNALVDLRFYEFNTFSLRRDAGVPAMVSDGVRVDSPTNTGQGSIGGGETVRLVSSMGGLAWVDRVEFVKSGGDGAVSAVVSEFPGRGDDEFAVAFDTVPVESTGVYDLVLYLNRSPQPPVLKLDAVYELKANETPGWLAPVLVGAGLAAALVGLAAGGKSGGGGGGGPCFIATAAYGTPLAAEVDALRGFRDACLLESHFGTALVDFYYRFSPPIAKHVAQSPALAAAVRGCLTPLVLIGQAVLAIPPPVVWGLFLGVCLLAVRARRRRRRALAAG